MKRQYTRFFSILCSLFLLGTAFFVLKRNTAALEEQAETSTAVFSGTATSNIEQLLPPEDQLPDMQDFVRMTVCTPQKQYEICFLEHSGLAYSDSYTWFWVQDGHTTTLDNDFADSFTDKVRFLVLGDCISKNATPEDIRSFGLDEPTVTVSVDYQTSTRIDSGYLASDGLPIWITEEEDAVFGLEIGANYNGEARYARIVGSGNVYLINARIADILMDTAPSDLLPDEVIVPDWEIVSSVDVILDGTTNRFVAYAEIAEDTGWVMRWQLQDKDVPFSEVAVSLERLYSTGRVPENTDLKDELLCIVFHRASSTYPVVKLAFYSYDEENCLTVLNGTPTLLVPTSRLSSLIDQIRQITAS